MNGATAVPFAIVEQKVVAVGDGCEEVQFLERLPKRSNDWQSRRYGTLDSHITQMRAHGILRQMRLRLHTVPSASDES